MANKESLRFLRRQAELTQMQLAVKADIHPVTLSKYERGVQRPSLIVAQRIAAALGISVDEIEFSAHQGVA